MRKFLFSCLIVTFFFTDCFGKQPESPCIESESSYERLYYRGLAEIHITTKPGTVDAPLKCVIKADPTTQPDAFFTEASEASNKTIQQQCQQQSSPHCEYLRAAHCTCEEEKEKEKKHHSIHYKISVGEQSNYCDRYGQNGSTDIIITLYGGGDDTQGNQSESSKKNNRKKRTSGRYILRSMSLGAKDMMFSGQDGGDDDREEERHTRNNQCPRCNHQVCIYKQKPISSLNGLILTKGLAGVKSRIDRRKPHTNKAKSIIQAAFQQKNRQEKPENNPKNNDASLKEKENKEEKKDINHEKHGEYEKEKLKKAFSDLANCVDQNHTWNQENSTENSTEETDIIYSAIEYIKNLKALLDEKRPEGLSANSVTVTTKKHREPNNKDTKNEDNSANSYRFRIALSSPAPPVQTPASDNHQIIVNKPHNQERTNQERTNKAPAVTHSSASSPQHLDSGLGSEDLGSIMYQALLQTEEFMPFTNYDQEDCRYTLKQTSSTAEDTRWSSPADKLPINKRMPCHRNSRTGSQDSGLESEPGSPDGLD